MPKMIVYENERFVVKVADNALLEDGRTYGRGYVVMNRDTGVNEYSGTILASAIYNADSFDAALSKLEAEVDEVSPQLDIPLDRTVN